MTFDPRIILPLPFHWRIGFFYVSPWPEESLDYPLVGIQKWHDDDGKLVIWQLIFFFLEIRLFEFESEG
jgi:hypothetical protein